MAVRILKDIARMFRGTLERRGGEPAMTSYGRKSEDGVYDTSRSPIPYRIVHHHG